MLILLILDGVEKVYLPSLRALVAEINAKAVGNVFRSSHCLEDSDVLTPPIEWMDVPMLARTHGQPATPTRSLLDISLCSFDVACGEV